MASELVSVVVPVYNVEPYLRKCISSIIQQTYTNLEIIIVNDGSTDQSGLICNEFATVDNRIKVIHQENKGLAGARNTGIEYAHGDYIGFVDSDDYIDEDYYEVLVNSIIKYKCDVAICGRYNEDGENTITQYQFDKAMVLDNHDAIKGLLLGNIISSAAWDKLYKISLFDDIRYPIGFISEDVVPTYEIMKKANGIVHCGKPMYHYLLRKGSLSRSHYNKKTAGIYTYNKYVCDDALKLYPDLHQESNYALFKILIYLDYLCAIDKIKNNDRAVYHGDIRKNLSQILSNTYLRYPFKVFSIFEVIGFGDFIARIAHRMGLFKV